MGGAPRTNKLRAAPHLGYGPVTYPVSGKGTAAAPPSTTALSDSDMRTSGKGAVGKTPLYTACEEGHTDVVEALIADKAEVDQVNSEDGFTPLHIACFSGVVDVIKLLLENGADVTKRDNTGNNPLHITVLAGRWQDKGTNLKVIETLLTHNPNIINDVNHAGDTPLHMAINLTDTADKDLSVADIVSEMLNESSKSVDVDLRDKEGYTPIHLAIKKGDWSTCCYLLRYLADLLLPNNEGKLPSENDFDEFSSSIVAKVFIPNEKEKQVTKSEFLKLIESVDNEIKIICISLEVEGGGIWMDTDAVMKKLTDTINTLVDEIENWLSSKEGKDAFIRWKQVEPPTSRPSNTVREFVLEDKEKQEKLDRWAEIVAARAAESAAERETDSAMGGGRRLYGGNPHLDYRGGSPFTKNYINKRILEAIEYLKKALLKFKTPNYEKSLTYFKNLPSVDSPTAVDPLRGWIIAVIVYLEKLYNLSRLKDRSYDIRRSLRC